MESYVTEPTLQIMSLPLLISNNLLYTPFNHSPKTCNLRVVRNDLDEHQQCVADLCVILRFDAQDECL